MNKVNMQGKMDGRDFFWASFVLFTAQVGRKRKHLNVGVKDNKCESIEDAALVFLNNFDTRQSVLSILFHLMCLVVL